MTVPLALAARGIKLIRLSMFRPLRRSAERRAAALFDRVLDASEAVAGTAGGWLGFGTVSGAERALRHDSYAQLAPGRL